MLTLNLNLLYTVVNVLVLFFLLRKFLFKPVADIIAQRQKLVDDDREGLEEMFRLSTERRKAFDKK